MMILRNVFRYRKPSISSLHWMSWLIVSEWCNHSFNFLTFTKRCLSTSFCSHFLCVVVNVLGIHSFHLIKREVMDFLSHFWVRRLTFISHYIQVIFIIFSYVEKGYLYLIIDEWFIMPHIYYFILLFSVNICSKFIIIHCSVHFVNR